MENQTEIAQLDAEKEKAVAFASLGDRMLAQAVDGLVGFGLLWLVGMALALRFGGGTGSGFNLTGGTALLGTALVVGLLLAYFIVLEAAFGTTLGKLTAGIRVQTTEGQRISLRAAVIRNLMRLIDVIGVYLVGGLSALITRRSQRLGDLAAGTVVVQSEPGRWIRVTALIAAVLVAIGGVVGSFWLRAHATPAAAPPAQEAPTATPSSFGER